MTYERMLLLLLMLLSCGGLPRTHAPPPQKVSLVAAFHSAERHDEYVQRLETRVVTLESQVAVDDAALAAKNDELADVRAQLAASRSWYGGAGAGHGTAAGSNRFVPGQCTWYVASRRSVDWLGNAIDWWWNARGIRPEGPIPRGGAIAVYWGGVYGHVAYVEEVYPDGSYLVSEMNWVAAYYVNQRVVHPGLALGFIY